MSISSLKILPALMVAITAAWATQPVFGGAVHQFVLTENSSTSLSATYDGSPITAIRLVQTGGIFYSPQVLLILWWGLTPM